MQVETQNLKTAAAIVEPARESRSPIPILTTIRATQNAAGLKLETNDLDMAITAILPIKANDNDDLDTFLINDPRAIISAISAAGGKDVGFRISKGKDKGIDHCLAITAGDLKLSQKTGMAAEEFPDFGVIADERFNSELSSETIGHIARVFPAMSTEETRYYLNGVHMKKVKPDDDSDWTYRFAATDGHRLFVVDVPLPSSTGALPSDVIIPRRFIQSVAKIMAKSKEAIPFRLGGGTVSNQKEKTPAPSNRNASRCSMTGKVGALPVSFDSKLIDGAYPDYTRVIPADVPCQATFDIKRLRQAVLSVASSTSDKTIRALKLDFTAGKATATKAIGYIGKCEAEFTIDCEHNCDGMTAGFNGRYLLEALNSFRGDEIVLSMEDASQVSGPMLLRDPADTAFFVVLMPMRV